ncbi:hypothetical protein BLNAU_11747 [Blattamonas nauphoetae]|uniref:Uncharacterized protein n=1 Tax=Blattamonas nauphoetae TaxID=2049346 RepID=A0ABQ9XNF6_9EUKA|nr:hypothetical protein BLNAU_11747 [Blattamonas nauphoetae]
MITVLPIISSGFTYNCESVALVTEEYQFNDALKFKAQSFLSHLGPRWNDDKAADKIVAELVSTSPGSSAAFFDSVLVLLSSPHSMVAESAFTFLNSVLLSCSSAIRLLFVEVDFITNMFAIIQPHTLPIARNVGRIHSLIGLIKNSIKIASPLHLEKLGVTDEVNTFNHREIICQKAVIPSGQFVTFLISNRYLLDKWLFHQFMELLCTLVDISPYHRPTLEFVLASPIVMAIPSRLSFYEDTRPVYDTLPLINNSFRLWGRREAEAVPSSKRMIQALVSEGFEDMLDQVMMFNESASFGDDIIEESQIFSHFLGSNISQSGIRESGITYRSMGRSHFKPKYWM